jgi:aconitate hydratase
VVGKFVEFYGPGLDELTLEDRATLANMAPEYGATCGFFPIDAETVAFLKNTARKPARVALVEKYAKAQGLWRTAKSPDPVFTDTLSLDMDSVEPCIGQLRRAFDQDLEEGRHRQQARQAGRQ